MSRGADGHVRDAYAGLVLARYALPADHVAHPDLQAAEYSVIRALASLDIDEPNESTRVTVRLPRNEVERIRDEVLNGSYPSASHVVRDALRHFLPGPNHPKETHHAQS